MSPARPPASVRLLRLVSALGAAGLAAGAAAVILWAREPGRVFLPALVSGELDRTGATNPVTAVLLDFRAYDTMLEIGVLILAVVGAWAVSGDEGPAARAVRSRAGAVEPVLAALVHLLVPLVVLAAVYLVWTGTRAPGGAFQAGALLGGAGVLLVLAGRLRLPPASYVWLRVALVFAFAAFLAVAAAVVPWTGRFLAYPVAAAYPIILFLEAAIAASTAAVLVVLFVEMAGRSGAEEQP